MFKQMNNVSSFYAFFEKYKETTGVDLNFFFNKFITQEQIDKTDLIIRSVLENMNITNAQFISTCRRRDIVEARMIVSHFLRKNGSTFHFIGLKQGGKNHATVIYQIQQFESLYFSDGDFRKNADEIAKKIGISL